MILEIKILLFLPSDPCSCPPSWLEVKLSVSVSSSSTSSSMCFRSSRLSIRFLSRTVTSAKDGWLRDLLLTVEGLFDMLKLFLWALIVLVVDFAEFARRTREFEGGEISCKKINDNLSSGPLESAKNSPCSLVEYFLVHFRRSPALLECQSHRYCTYHVGVTFSVAPCCSSKSKAQNDAVSSPKYLQLHSWGGLTLCLWNVRKFSWTFAERFRRMLKFQE